MLLRDLRITIIKVNTRLVTDYITAYVYGKETANVFIEINSLLDKQVCKYDR